MKNSAFVNTMALYAEATIQWIGSRVELGHQVHRQVLMPILKEELMEVNQDQIHSFI